MLHNIRKIDAFIPSLNLGKIFLKNQQKNNLLTYQNLLNTKKNGKNNKNKIIMNSVTGNEILTILNDEFDIKEKNLKTTIQSFSPNYRRLITILIFSSSLLFGWILAPSKNKIISLGFSGIFGVFGFLLVKKFNSKNNAIIKKKIVQYLKSTESISDAVRCEKVFSKIQQEFNLSYEDLKIEVFEIYQKYLELLLKKPIIKLQEIQEIIKLKSILGLSQQEIGDCHYQFAQNLYKTFIVMKEREDTNDSNLIVNNFFFLSDRMFSLDTVKGYQYELARIRKIFLLSEENVKKDCIQKGTNLYKNYIEERLKNKSVSTTTLYDIASILGLNEQLKTKINLEFFDMKISKTIVLGKKITEENIKFMHLLKDLLNIQEEIFQKIVSNKTGPFFSDEIIKIMEESISKNGDENIKNFTEKIVSIKNDFLLSEEFCFIFFTIGITKILNQKIEAVLRSKNRKNIDFQDDVLKLLILRKNFESIFCNLFPEKRKNFSEKLEEILLRANSNFNNEELKQVYKLYFNECLNKGIPTTPEDEENLLNLQKILGLEAQKIEEIKKSCIEPLFYKQIEKFFKEKDYSQTNKEKIENLILALKMEYNIAIKIKMDFYKEYLTNILSKDGFPTKVDENNLDELRRFFSLRYKDVQESHDLLSEPKYSKSMLEAMGATGVIPSNYWNGLEKLRKRLRMSEKKAKEIFYKTVKEKLRVGFEKAVMENKRKKLSKETEGKENGEDPNIIKGAGTALGIEVGNSTGNELINIVDFYTKNGVFVEKDKVINKTKQKTLCGQNGRKENKNFSKSRIEYIYPVNLEGSFQKKITSDMYRDYLVDCFSAKTQNEKRKLFYNLEKLGPILGLNKNEIENVHTNVGSLVYKQFLSQSLNKGFISKPDMAFLSNIQNTLSLTGEQCSDFIREAKRNKISFLIEGIFSSPKIDSNKVSELRETTKQLGVDLSNDLEISNDQRSKLFRVEIDAAIEKGLIDNENQQLIKDIQLSYGLNDDLSKKILVEIISQRCENYLLNAIASLRRNSMSNLVSEVEKMLNFGTFLPVYIKNSIISKKERMELFSKYQIENNSSLSEDVFSKKIDLLKIMLGIE
jgi:hypothetical protein